MANALPKEGFKRPSIIWFALIYLFVSIGANLLVLESNLNYFLRFDVVSVVALLINLGVSVLAIVTFVAILKRAPIGRKLAVITFAILGFFSIYGAVTMLEMNSSRSIFIPVIVIAFRFVIAILFIGYFAFSEAAKAYFLNGVDTFGNVV